MGSRRGIRTRVMLVAPLVLVIASVVAASLLIVRDRMRRQIELDLSGDLAHSVETFQNLQNQRRIALSRENALLANLPSLKALMTTNDQRTIEDGAIEFWKVSGNDLFAVASKDGRVRAAYTVGEPAGPSLRRAIEGLIFAPEKHYIVSGGRLFELSVRPLYFGEESSGVLLGYTVLGYAIDRKLVGEISQASAAEATFLASGRIVASTLLPSRQADLPGISELAERRSAGPTRVTLRGENYLAATEDLSSGASMPLHLLVLKSFDQAERAARDINRLLLMAGLFALLLGCGLMLVLSARVTGPLESLAKGVRAFGSGDGEAKLPEKGTLEVQELSAAFARMRDEIRDASRVRLESERLATIGRMASSVSHDLRHYLAAVYANAEFLSLPHLGQAERTELFEEIRSAVLGTTELIDSLLIFSRTGAILQRSSVEIGSIAERSVELVRAHPDAAGVRLRTRDETGRDVYAMLDAKKMERATYNLLLNACQSTRGRGLDRQVDVLTAISADGLAISVTDNGCGVPEGVRDSLFLPFVSEGKQSGTGLGLTLAFCIAEEHGGVVTLERSRPGETTFRLSVPMEAPISKALQEIEEPKVGTR